MYSIVLWPTSVTTALDATFNHEAPNYKKGIEILVSNGIIDERVLAFLSGWKKKGSNAITQGYRYTFKMHLNKKLQEMQYGIERLKDLVDSIGKVEDVVQEISELFIITNREQQIESKDRLRYIIKGISFMEETNNVRDRNNYENVTNQVERLVGFTDFNYYIRNWQKTPSYLIMETYHQIAEFQTKFEITIGGKVIRTNKDISVAYFKKRNNQNDNYQENDEKNQDQEMNSTEMERNYKSYKKKNATDLVNNNNKSNAAERVNKYQVKDPIIEIGPGITEWICLGCGIGNEINNDIDNETMVTQQCIACYKMHRMHKMEKEVSKEENKSEIGTEESKNENREEIETEENKEEIVNNNNNEQTGMENNNQNELQNESQNAEATVKPKKKTMEDLIQEQIKIQKERDLRIQKERQQRLLLEKDRKQHQQILKAINQQEKEDKNKKIIKRKKKRGFAVVDDGIDVQARLKQTKTKKDTPNDTDDID